MNHLHSHNTPHDPDWIQELLAGHVLGNLDPDEAEQLHQILKQDPELVEQTQQLRETLELLPYGLPLPSPPTHLRSRLLQISDPPPSRQTEIRIPWSVLVVTSLTFLLVALGIERHRLQDQIASLQTQLDQEINQEQLPVASDPFSQMILPSDVILANHWEGLDQLLSDHLRSITQAQGPVDYRSNQVSVLTQWLQDQVSLPEDLPQMLTQKSQLIGGSPCDLGGTRGARFSFQYSQEVILSFYVLARQEDPQFPRAGSRILYIQEPHQPGILLWEDRNYIYSLVAQLPAPTLRELALRARQI